MSEFSVHRTADTIPALKYCLILDGERIAGGKPDYRGNNHLISWRTDKTYGPVDGLMAENAKLRMLIDLKQTCWKYVGWCSECPYNGLDDEHDDCNCAVREKVNSLARELGIEVDE